MIYFSGICINANYKWSYHENWMSYWHKQTALETEFYKLAFCQKKKDLNSSSAWFCYDSSQIWMAFSLRVYGLYSYSNYKTLFFSFNKWFLYDKTYFKLKCCFIMSCKAIMTVFRQGFLSLSQFYQIWQNWTYVKLFHQNH